MNIAFICSISLPVIIFLTVFLGPAVGFHFPTLGILLELEVFLLVAAISTFFTQLHIRNDIRLCLNRLEASVYLFKNEERTQTQVNNYVTRTEDAIDRVRRVWFDPE